MGHAAQHPCLTSPPLHLAPPPHAQGFGYLAKEKARLEKLISSSSVSSDKLEEMNKKVSVLGHLLGDD